MQLVFVLFEVQLLTSYLDVDHIDRLYKDFFPKFHSKNYLLLLVPFSIIYMSLRLLMSIPVRSTDADFRGHKESLQRRPLPEVFGRPRQHPARDSHEREGPEGLIAG